MENKFRSKFDLNDLNILKKYAFGRKFIIETGSGISTEYIASNMDDDCLFYSIDVCDVKNQYRFDRVKYLKGWSINYSDFIKPQDENFVKNNCAGVDRKIVFGKEKDMDGEKDLIRKILKENSDLDLDFFFSDCGEYCGYPEWLIVKDVIKKGGIFAAHDIYYPKSIKNFKVVEEIEKSKEWKVLEKTKTRQGLFIAVKI
jgi:hypothetical protein